MRHARSLRLASLWLGVLAVSAMQTACGGSAKPPATAEAPATPASEVLAPALDLTEVAEPADVVALVRWNNPDASVAAVQGWTGLPLALRDLIRGELPAWIGDLVATSAPADLVVTLAPGRPTEEPKFSGALAVGLDAPLEEARRSALAQGEQLQQLQPGIYRLESSSGLACALSASVGATQTRLVCGEEPGDIARLGPYMTRTLPRLAPFTNDLSAEIRVAPFERRYGATAQQMLRMGASVLPSQLHIGQPRFDRALTDAIYAIVEEGLSLTTDLDALSLGISAHPETATGSFALKFRGSKSWLVQTISDAGRRAAAAPPMFFRLPADASAASFGRSASVERFAGIRENLATLLDGFLAHEGVKAADRQALVELFSDKYASDAPTVSASGPYDEAVRAALVGKDQGPKAKAFGEKLANAGWQIYGIEEPAEKWVTATKRVVSAYNGAGLKKYLQRGLSALDIEFVAPEVKLIGAPKGLPQGSIELAVSFFPDAKAGAKPQPGSGVSFYVLGMPDAGRTWMAVGLDRATLVSRLQAVQASASESGTLASRPGLEKLKSGSYSSAGFMTVSGMARSLESALAESFPKFGLAAPDLDRVLRAIPHAGATPIIVENVVEQAGAAPVWKAELAVPKQAIEDVVAAVMQVALGQATAVGRR